MIYIESKDNNLFKNIKKLKEKRYRIRENKFLLEGFRIVEEAIKAKVDLEYIVINIELQDKVENLEVYKENSKIIFLSKTLFIQLSDTENSQGIIAVVKNKINDKNIEGNFFVICDKVQDPGNLGTIIRTSHAAGVEGIILTKGTADIYNEKTIRSTMGSIFYIPIYYDDENFSIIKDLKDKGVSLVATSLQGARNFFEEDLKGKIMIAVGNEGNGISEELFHLSDKKVKIPMPGEAESLNVAVATSIILFEKVRQNLI
ncbi:RNA methyltransferase [Clostridium sp.]|uniref:TrmH family RNA methyltransferase n=1 Tax=Clostridium sp. TaxID=1506 RepID=UPI002628B27C|nr:RNA methyltransferase [Clostridium sp.]